MRVRLLGPTQVEGDGTLGRRDRVVLAALVVHAGEPLSVDQIAVALWGDAVPPSSAKVVQGVVSRLRHALGAERIRTTSSGYVLELDGLDLDVVDFERLVGRARELLAVGDANRAAAVYGQALSCWSGPALADLADWDDGRAEAARLSEVRESVEEELVESLLACGRTAEAVAEGRRLVSRASTREHRWALYARALYRAGRQREALDVLRRARTVLREEVGLDPGSELVELERAVLDQDPALGGPDEAPVRASDVCPYPGLRSFDAEQADLFAGREQEVTDCLARLDTSRFLVVVGASGSGKSSLVRAGLVPALRRRGQPVVVLTPGAAPTATLAAAAAAQDAPVVVVDQLEELFAPTSATHVTGFLDGLTGLVDGGRTVVATIRADHLASLSGNPGLARHVERGVLLLGPLSEGALRRAIEEPARRSGLLLEPGLVDLLVRDVLDERGALPLLGHALAETWARREGSVLTVAGYTASGGINGAVAQSAERLYLSLDAADRDALRAVVQRLVSSAPGGDPVVVRVPTRVFLGTDDAPRLLDLLVRARLVTTDADTAALAHESLVRAWPRLRSWLDEDVDGQRTLTHLQVTADAWDRAGRPTDELYRAARLQNALEWRARAHPVLAPTEEAFLDASAEHEQDEHREQTRRLQAKTRANRQLVGALAAVVLLLGVALLGGSLAVGNGRRAASSALAAAASAADARGDRLVSASQSEPRIDVALLLARQAVEMSPRPSLQGSLLDALTRRNIVSSASAGVFVPQRFDDSAVSPDGSRVVLDAMPTDDATDTGPYLVDAGSGRVITSMGIGAPRADWGRQPWVAGFVDGGRTVAVMRDTADGSGREIVRIDAASGAVAEPAAPVPGSITDDFFGQDRMSISPDGRTLVSLVDRTLRVWTDAGAGWTGPRLLPLPALTPSRSDQEAPDAIRFSADGRRVAVVMEYAGRAEANPPQLALAVDLATGTWSGPYLAAVDVALSPDGSIFAVASQLGGVTLHDVGGGATVLPGVSTPGALAFSADGAQLVVGYRDGSVEVFTTDPLRLVLRTPATSVPVRLVALPVGGSTVVAVDEESRTTTVSLRGASSIVATTPTSAIDHVSVGPPGTIVAAGFYDGKVTVFDQGDLRRVRDLWLGPYPEPDGTYDPPLHRRVTALAVTPDGTAVVAADRTGHLRMWSVADGRLLWSRDDVHASWLAVSPDGKYLATSEFTEDLTDAPVPEGAHPDGFPVTDTVRVWDLSDALAPVLTDPLTDLANRDGGPPKPRALAFSPDSSMLAASWFGDGPALIVYDVHTGARVLTTPDDPATPSVSAMTFTLDGRRLIAWESSGDIVSRDLRSGDTTRVASGGRGDYASLAYSSDGRLLIGVSGYDEVRLSIWDASTYAPIGSTGNIPATDGDASLAPTADGQVFVGTGIGVERLDLDVEHWKAAACALAGRPLTTDEWDAYLPGTPYSPACA
ncbi:BTAD domain-containing putative transcriptional regulator [Cellulomonas sp. ICMP 17802]|uniref:nSTAND1 domain-containing NTPase n=1 Tax=Cellulomonas sp. ICMP 17802 TaxID=3239199 RepID=UPI00351BBD93